MSQSFEKFMKKFAGWIDPKLEPYREHKKLVYTPETLEDLLGVMKRTPTTVLTPRQRTIIAAAMSFQDTPVKQLMTPRADITFVYENDFLGPLMLDKLYQSGSQHFPVLTTRGEIAGILHTKTLNSLEDRQGDRAANHLDKNVYYIREDYSLEQAVAAFARTNCYFFIVIDRTGNTVGLLNFETLLEHLLGHISDDKFDQDNDSYAVSHRI